MKIFIRPMRSQKWKGLLVAVVKFDDGAQLLLTPKPDTGERIEDKVRPIQDRSKKHQQKIGGDA